MNNKIEVMKCEKLSKLTNKENYILINVSLTKPKEMLNIKDIEEINIPINQIIKNLSLFKNKIPIFYDHSGIIVKNNLHQFNKIPLKKIYLLSSGLITKEFLK